MLLLQDRYLKPADPVFQPDDTTASGLVQAVPFSERDGLNVRDLSGNNCDGTFTNGREWGVGPLGPAARSDGTSWYLDFGKIAKLDVSGNLNLSLWVRPMTNGGSGGYLWADFDAAGNNSQGSLYILAGKVGWFQSGGAANFQSTLTFTAGDLLHIAVVRDHTAKTITIYVNGVVWATSSYSGSLTAQSSCGNRVMGRAGSFNGNYAHAWYSDLRVAKDAAPWAPGQVQDLYSEGRWRLYQEPLWYPGPTALNNYTLAAAAGSFAETGSAAGLKRGLRVPAVAGAFTLSGQAATLRATRRVSAAAGAVTLTGQPAGLVATRKVAGATGPFTLSGQAATLRSTRTLGAGAGGFAETGAAANLRAERRLSASAGAAVLSGQSAGLIRSLRIVTDAGAFSLSGSSAALLQAHRLAVAAGAFTHTGEGAGLRNGKTLTAAAGSCVLSGASAGLVRSLRLPAEAGAVDLAGTDATLRRGRNFTAAAGGFTHTGAAADLRVTRRLAGVVGAYVLAGKPAGLTVSTPNAGPICYGGSVAVLTAYGGSTAIRVAYGGTVTIRTRYGGRARICGDE